MSKIFNITKFEYDSENASIKLDKYLGSSTQISDYRERVIHHIEYMPSGEQFSEQRDNWATPYKFNGKELDAETGLYYYGARYYTPEIGIWLSVDPMSDKYPSLSPYAYCGNNPVMLVDLDGREIWMTGDAASEAFSQLQNKSNLKLSINSEGKVEAKGIAWTKADRMIKKASKDQNVKVNIEAKKANSFTFQDGATLPTESGGGYGGNEVKNGKVNTFQKVVPSMLGDMDSKVGDRSTGGYMLHELAESYYGGKIAQNEGSSPRQGIVGSTYDRAHNMANKISLGGFQSEKQFKTVPDFKTKSTRLVHSHTTYSRTHGTH